MAKEQGLKDLHTIHRIDRLTSGLLLYARNPKKAKEMAQQIRTRVVNKEYFCRVEGRAWGHFSSGVRREARRDVRSR